MQDLFVASIVIIKIMVQYLVIILLMITIIILTIIIIINLVYRNFLPGGPYGAVPAPARDLINAAMQCT